MDRFNVGQLTKEMVVWRLTELQDPCMAAADITKKTILIALENAQILEPEHKQSVIEITAGAMTGLLLADQNLSHGSVCILKKTYDAALQLNLNPTEIMALALRGIVHIRKYTTTAQFGDIIVAITTEFMGVGETLQKICEETEDLRSDHLAQPQP